MFTESDFEVVDRSEAVDSEIPSALLDALVATEKSDKAVRVSMKGKHMINFQSTLRNRLRKLGFRLRYKFNKTTKDLTMYVEKYREEDTEDPLITDED